MLKGLFGAIFPSHAKAEEAISNALKIQPQLVSEMIQAMGANGSSLFLNHLKFHDFKEIETAVFTFYVYRIYVNNQHPVQIKWWRDRMLENGFDVRFTNERVEMTGMYLQHAGVEYMELLEFSRQYNNQFCPG